MLKWISVEDELPKHCVEVIVQYGNTVDKGMHHDKRGWTDEPFGRKLKVVRWQPFPESLKEELP